MCENVRHIQRELHESRESYVARCRARGQEFPCRMCEECAASAEGRIVGDFVAHKQTTQRCLMALLTYDDRILIRSGRPNAYRMTIGEAKDDARLWIIDVRKVLRRMHPELKVKVDACRVTEMRQLADSPDCQSRDAYGRRQVKAPRISSPPRVHHHVVIWITVEWKDAERQRREPAQWRDSLIPRLRTDEWLYHHQWENKAEAKQRGGRVRPSSTPWRLGMVSYSEPRGGEGYYLAKYCSKALRTRQQYKADRYQNWTKEQLLDFARAEASFKSFRKSPGLGHGFYRMQGRAQAEQGLPPRLTFQPTIDVAAGGLYRRTITENAGVSYIDASGALRSDRVQRKVRPNFMLQRVGRQRALLTAYDDRRLEVFGAGSVEPSGPNYRTKIVNGKSKVFLVYGLDEAREAIAKDDDRRTIAKRDRQLARQRRCAPDNRDLDRLAGKVSDELAFGRGVRPPGRKRRAGESRDAWARRLAARPKRTAAPSDRVECSSVAKITRNDHVALVKAWEGKFERDVLRRLDGLRTQAVEAPHYHHLERWLSQQLALYGVADDYIGRLARSMRERWRARWIGVHHGAPTWRPWRKGRRKAGTICG